MSTRAPLKAPSGPPQEDHVLQLRGATWADYQRLLEIRGEHSAPRIAYLDGTLEIVSPSQNHESIKSTIGRLVEVWCLEHGIEFSTYGSWTLQSKPRKRGAEPDECYVFGDAPRRKRPDLAIEIVWTFEGIDKLEIYRVLGIPEVWYWRQGTLQISRLRGTRYVRAAASRMLPGIDVEQLATFVGRSTTSQAIREYSAALRNAR